MSEHVTDPARPEARGDVLTPSADQQRQDAPGAFPEARAENASDTDQPAGAPMDWSPRQDTNTYGIGAQTPDPSIWPGYVHRPLGPGNEAMEGGASPAPRGFTGGAMGKFLAGLSPSFSAAAMGDSPPGGLGLYTPAEAAATFTGGARVAIPDEAAGPAPA